MYRFDEIEMPLLLEKRQSSLKALFELQQNKSLNKKKAIFSLLKAIQNKYTSPEIQCSFQQSTFHKKCSQKRLQKLKPIISQSNLRQKPQLPLWKSKKSIEQIKIKINSAHLQNQQACELAKTNSNLPVSQHIMPMKITKSFNGLKKELEKAEIPQYKPKKFIYKAQAIQNKADQRSNRISRSISAQRELKEESSKFILKKLQQLHEKQTYMNIHYKDSRSMSLPKRLSKQLKLPAFVVKHKLSLKIDGQQRQQLNLLVSEIQHYKGLDLSKGMSIKSYGGFSSKIITSNN